MTREAIEYFKFHRKIFCEDHLKICPKDSIAYQATLKEKEFCDMAIKALEQESVLDKVRAEIDECGSIWVAYAITGHSDRDIENLIEGVVNQAKEQVLNIIDKYRTESEE